MIPLFIKDRKRRKGEFQFFMHDFVDACKKNGIKSKPDYIPYYNWHYRAVLREALYCIYRFVHKFFPGLIRRNKAIIITANGYTIKDIAFPYYFTSEIIPFLWDVWPNSWNKLYKSIEDFDIKMLFVSSSQVAQMINSRTNTKAFWIPEGIVSSHYKRGRHLKHRMCDVFEVGRQMKKYHQILEKMNSCGNIKCLLKSNILANGALDDKNVAFANSDYYQILADTKIMVCFPHCDTNKDRAGDVETLTQRYWEAMLSRCVMIGRAPKELIDLIGYNPVISVDWGNPESQICSILDSLELYQNYVDNNYETAKRMADWSNRIPNIISVLQNNGYYI